MYAFARDLIAKSCHKNGKIFIHLARVPGRACQARGKDDRWITSTLLSTIDIRVQDNITSALILWVVEWGNTGPILWVFRDLLPQTVSRRDVRSIVQDIHTFRARRTDLADEPISGRYLTMIVSIISQKHNVGIG